MRTSLLALSLACAGCAPPPERHRERPAPAQPPVAPTPVIAPRANGPRGERALWALQQELAALRAPLRTTPRLPAGAPRSDVPAVELRIEGRPWTARIVRCDPPRQTDCAGGWEDGVCECAILLVEAGAERRTLVLSESAALGRPRMAVLDRPAPGGQGLWVAADLYDRRTPWPRVGWLVEAEKAGGSGPVLAWRGEVGSCAFEVRGDPEEERAPSTCTAPEAAARYGPGDELVIELPSGARTVLRGPGGELTGG